jgi:hypothetical protein
MLRACIHKRFDRGHAGREHMLSGSARASQRGYKEAQAEHHNCSEPHISLLTKFLRPSTTPSLKMSDFVGAGFYRIESIPDRNARVALSGGGRTDGTKVVIWFVCSASVSFALTITERVSQEKRSKQERRLRLYLRWSWQVRQARVPHHQQQQRNLPHVSRWSSRG